MPRKLVDGRQKLMQCPVCDTPSRGPQGLAAHVRSAHKAHFAQYGVQPAPEAPPPPAVEPERQSVVIDDLKFQAPVEVVERNPLALLDTAIGNLQARSLEIKTEIARLGDLTREKEITDARIEALTAARRAFEEPAPKTREAAG